MIPISYTYPFPVPTGQLRPALADAALWSRALPGSEPWRQFSDRLYQGAVVVERGPLAGRYVGSVRLLEATDHSGQFQLNFEGAPGTIGGRLQAWLEPQAGQTLLQIDGTLAVNGRLATVAPRLLQSGLRSLLRQSCEQIQAELTGIPIAHPPSAHPDAPAWPLPDSLAETMRQPAFLRRVAVAVGLILLFRALRRRSRRRLAQEVAAMIGQE